MVLDYDACARNDGEMMMGVLNDEVWDGRHEGFDGCHPRMSPLSPLDL